MFLPLALLLPAGDRLRRAVLAVSCGQVLALTFINRAHFLNVLVMLVAPLLAARYLKDWPRLPWRNNPETDRHQTPNPQQALAGKRTDFPHWSEARAEQSATPLPL
jgi:hypothetical protein